MDHRRRRTTSVQSTCLKMERMKTHLISFTASVALPTTLMTTESRARCSNVKVHVENGSTHSVSETQWNRSLNTSTMTNHTSAASARRRVISVSETSVYLYSHSGLTLYMYVCAASEQIMRIKSNTAVQDIVQDTT